MSRHKIKKGAFTYIILDSRAPNLPSDDGCFVDYKDSMVMESGTAHECCDICNANVHGAGCVVADVSGEIMWHWFHTGIWIVE